MAPLVSVLTPYLDAADTLPATLASVLDQSLTDWELIAADDGSRDGSHALAEAAAHSDPRLRVLPPEARRSGAGAARNRALQAARGRYIAFLDADDLWLPDKLARQLAAMRAANSPFSCTGYILRRPNRPDQTLIPPTSQTRDMLLRGNRIGCLTAIYDTAHFGKVPMPEIPRRQDFALWLDLLRRTDHALGLPEPLAIHIRRAGSLSANPVKATWGTWRVYRDHAGLGRGSALMHLGQHLAQRILR